MTTPANIKIDMSGKIYNSWRVIEFAETIKSVGYWKAECLKCNKNYKVHGPNVRFGKSKNCSNCGCKNSSSIRTGVPRRKTTAKETAEKYLYTQLKTSATKREIVWNISHDEMLKLIYDNCVYCGTEPKSKCEPLKNHGLAQKTLEGATITRNGIDRVDSSKGYTQENVVTCCETCNRMKLDHDTNDFKQHIAKIAKHLKL